MSSIAPDKLFSAFADTRPSADDPRAEIMLGAGVAAAFFIGLMGWAAFAPMDAGAFAPGVVVVSGHRQTIQARDGGTISGLLVKEGDRVRAGQPLVEFTPGEARTAERALTAREIGLEAQLARLAAQQAGLNTITPPARFAGLSPDDRVIADQAMAVETRTLHATYADDAARRALARQHAAEARQQIAGYEQQLQANARQHELNEAELKSAQELADQGYAPITRVQALQRSEAGLEGDAGARAAEVARLRAVAGEAPLESLQVDSERAQLTGQEIRKAQADLQEVAPQVVAAREHLSLTEVTAPVSGSVVNLTANTVHGVVGPGQKLMEIVPDRLPLVVEAQITPRDADQLKVGSPAQIRFSGRGARPAPVLHGTLTRLSADSVVEERTGRAYFTADITVPQAELARLSGGGDDASLRPGVPVDVVMPLRKRSALQYRLEPLTQSLWRSFREP